MEETGEQLRHSVDGWHCTSLGGRELLMSELSGKLTKTAGTRNTTCNVEAFDYLLRKLHDRNLPEVEAAERARADLLGSIRSVIQLLDWRSFELLVDLIFAQSGWRRIGENGGSQKTVDLELVLPSTGERAFVQVKSRTNQSQLNDYLEVFGERSEDRMFYVFHSVNGHLKSDDATVSLIGPDALAPMALDAGLINWVLERAG